MILQQQIEHIVEQVNEMKDADFFQVREKVRYLNSVPTNSLNPNELVEILTYFQNFVIHLPMSIFPDVGLAKMVKISQTFEKFHTVQLPISGKELEGLTPMETPCFTLLTTLK